MADIFSQQGIQQLRNMTGLKLQNSGTALSRLRREIINLDVEEDELNVGKQLFRIKVAEFRKFRRAAYSLPCDNHVSKSPKRKHCTKSTPLPLIVLKRPRTGSTWLKKILRLELNFHIDFEPFTDDAKNYAMAMDSTQQTSSQVVTVNQPIVLDDLDNCRPSFFTNTMVKMLRGCVKGAMRNHRADPNYWLRNCSRTEGLPSTDCIMKPVHGFMVNPTYIPDAASSLQAVLEQVPDVRFIVLIRQNLAKTAVSNLKRLANSSGGLREEMKGRIMILKTGMIQISPDLLVDEFKKEHKLMAGLFKFVPHKAVSYNITYEAMRVNLTKTIMGAFEFFKNNDRHVASGIRRKKASVHTGWASIVEQYRGKLLKDEQTQWIKAPESLSNEISNFDEIIKAVKSSYPCLWAQLQDSNASTQWALSPTASEPCAILE